MDRFNSTFISSCLLIVCILFSVDVTSQTRRTESDIAFEEGFIKAKQKSLLGKHADAAQILTALIEKDNLSAHLFYELSLVNVALKDLIAARDGAVKATRLEPRNAQYWTHLAHIDNELKNYQQAAQAIEQAISIASSKELYWQLHHSYAAGGNVLKAIQALDKAENIYGLNYEMTDTKVQMYIDNKMPDKALEALKAHTTQRPGKVENWTRLAKFQQLMDDKKAAIESYQKVLELNPHDASAHFQITLLTGDAETDQRFGLIIADEQISLEDKIKSLLPELKQAVAKNDYVNLFELKKYADKLVDQYPRAAQSHAMRGDINNILGDNTSAAIDFISSLKYAKSNFEVWLQLMGCLRKNEDWKALSEHSQKFLDYYPNQPMALAYYALNMAAQKKDKEAQTYRAEAGELAANNVEYIVELSIIDAIMFMHQGNIGEAITLIEDLTAKLASDRDLFELLGDLYNKSNNKEAARTAWEKAKLNGAFRDRISLKLSTAS